MLILRPVAASDIDSLVALATQLDSVNLPAERDFLEGRIEQSLRSFADELRPGTFVFVLEDTEARRCIGTSTIMAKLGSPEAPYYWLEVSSEERRSAELGRSFSHQRLRLRSSEDGPTEIGGLILDPTYRRHPTKCGKALSIVRFAFISAHPSWFQMQVIAEMLSPFEAPGQNLLWDAFGAKFTGLSYKEADRLSGQTKQFIADLFPQDPVYVALFPENVQEMIGQPNETAVAAVRILEKVGFHPLNQVDPFDGGPYYGAARDAIVSVRERREFVLPVAPAEEPANDQGPLALLSAQGEFGFRATVVPLARDGMPAVSKSLRDALGVGAGDKVAVTPLP